MEVKKGPCTCYSVLPTLYQSLSFVGIETPLLPESAEPFALEFNGIVMARQVFLPVGLVKCDGTGNRYIQRFDNTYLGNDEIAVSHTNDLLAYTAVLITKNKRYGLGKVKFVQPHGIGTEVRGIYFMITLPQLGKAFLRVGILVYGKPFGGAGRTFGAPFFMTGYFGVEDENVLQTHGIGCTHNGGDIMGIGYIFEYYGNIGLSFVKNGGKPVVAFWRHRAKVGISL